MHVVDKSKRRLEMWDWEGEGYSLNGVAPLESGLRKSEGMGLAHHWRVKQLPVPSMFRGHPAGLCGWSWVSQRGEATREGPGPMGREGSCSDEFSVPFSSPLSLSLRVPSQEVVIQDFYTERNQCSPWTPRKHPWNYFFFWNTVIALKHLCFDKTHKMLAQVLLLTNGNTVALLCKARQSGPVQGHLWLPGW